MFENGAVPVSMPLTSFATLRKLGAVFQHLSGLLLPPVNEHTLQPADDDDRKDDALIFVRLELAAQPLCGFPDVRGEIVELGLVERLGP